MKYHIDKEKVEFSFSRRQFNCLLAVEAILWVLAISCIIWGFLQFREVHRLQEENILHQRQLEIANTQLQALEKRMEKLDALDQELRKMVSGGQGSGLGQGEGATLARKPEAGQPTSPGALLKRLAALAEQADKRALSLSMIQLAIRDGVELQPEMVQRNFEGNKDSDTPSLWPAQGMISSPFGWRVSPITGRTSFHEGVDIAADYGTPIRATAKGVVTRSGYVSGYGYLVEIQHAGDIITRYGHNSLNIAQVGAEVKAGDIIALMGSTGNSTGSHVHYEVRIHGTPVDPQLFLPSSSRTITELKNK